MSVVMQRNIALVAALVCVTLPLWAQSLSTPVSGQGPLPNFDHAEVTVRKTAFFDYLRPIVRQLNAQIQTEREWLLDYLNDADRGWFDRRRWKRLVTRYRVPLDLPEDEAAATLLRRVDIVPESLALAQAAKESGWGRSRFAREGNALFGERCFSPGCGMLPTRRVPGAKHEVEAFPTAAASVESYLLNINTHERYLDLRRERQRLRKAGKPLRGAQLAPYATSYSERREKYVAEIIALISHNGLETHAAR